MAYPSDAGQYTLDTDACGFSIGAVLSQVQKGRERVIAYGSKTLSKSERNYCVTDRELLAVKHFVEYYRHYLLGRKFLVRSDHQALKWLFSLKEPKNRVARWVETRSAFDFEIEYRPGAKHQNADAMSRCPNPRDCRCSDTTAQLKCGPCSKCKKKSMDMQSSLYDCFKPKNETGAIRSTTEGNNTTQDSLSTEPQPHCETGRVTRGLSYTLAHLQKCQREDPDISPILGWQANRKRPPMDDVVSLSPATRHYWLQWDSLVLKNRIVYRQFQRKDGTGSHQQYLTPRSLKQEVLGHMHDSVLSGHLGCKKTQEKTMQRFYWFQLREDIEQWIAVEVPAKKAKAPLGRMKSGAPMDRLSTDILGPLPLTPRNNRYVLVINDHFTKRGEHAQRLYLSR